MDKWEPSSTVGGMQTGAATVENGIGFPKKSKNGTSFDAAIPLLEIYTMNPETPIQKPMHPNVHSSTIYNSQVLEAA